MKETAPLLRHPQIRRFGSYKGFGGAGAERGWLSTEEDVRIHGVTFLIDMRSLVYTFVETYQTSSVKYIFCILDELRWTR